MVDETSKCLIIDQTIERLGFCAADRWHDRSFCYICRDGTTRRWMCHGFLTGNADSGKRLSQAVGYAFQVYLDRVQRQEAEIARALRHTSDISICHERSVDVRTSNRPVVDKCSVMSPKTRCDSPNIAIERPHASPAMLDRFERQESFRLPNAQSPFKRQLSLRVSDLPSNVQRQRDFLSAIENHQPQRKIPLTFKKQVESQPCGAQNNQNYHMGGNDADKFSQSLTITSCANTTSHTQFTDGIDKLTSSSTIPRLKSTALTTTVQLRIHTSQRTPMARVPPYHHELNEMIKEESVTNLPNTNRWSQISPTVSELLEADMSTVQPTFKALRKPVVSTILRNEAPTNRSFDEDWLAAAHPRVKSSCTNPFMCSNDDMR